ncbi:hypothetical protein EIN_274910 [Entamoeba invadens IP1]|uniref:RING-type domain-containing protein n=1 Tax=Entamoeba invadens IP1 TaxID=370355 RepID=A0A0A1U1I9_ENTIV|nr:hypothetical protein EIN_274910 [Entamoeba invadens IP1]ELP87904.1 hypothetical protein EIN_274910 [Entamoeba invadens IP1]|eukprot:XP_004254675.1 hypothetical protein EIN_274910 [Entamoeba invadens IP1]
MTDPIDENLLVQKVSQDYECPICMSVPHPSHAIEHSQCGKIFCEKCIFVWWEFQHKCVCPYCRGDFTDFQTVKKHSRALYNILMEQKFRCPVSGCSEIISFNEYIKHMKKHNNNLETLPESVSDKWTTVYPEDQSTEEIFEKPFIVKWFNENNPWELLIFPDGLNESNRDDIAVFVGTTNDVRSRAVVSIEIKQGEFYHKKIAKHSFSPQTGRPGFIQFCPKNGINFGRPFLLAFKATTF